MQVSASVAKLWHSCLNETAAGFSIAAVWDAQDASLDDCKKSQGWTARAPRPRSLPQDPAVYYTFPTDASPPPAAASQNLNDSLWS